MRLHACKYGFGDKVVGLGVQETRNLTLRGQIKEFNKTVL